MTVCDISEPMLRLGRNRAEELGYINGDQIDWIVGDAENLPIKSNSMSAYTISFGLRHTNNINKVSKVNLIFS